MTCRWMSWSAGSGRGRRTAAAGVLAPARGLVQRDAPPIFFSVLAEKKTGRARSKRKDRFDALRCSGPPRVRGSAYQCLLRFFLAFGHAWAFCEVDTAVPWRMVRRGSGWLSHGIASLFAAAGCPAREPMQRADEGIGPYGDTVGLVHFVGADLRVGPCEGDEGLKLSVGADALVRPPAQAATTAQAARSEAERAERGAGQMRFCTPTQDAPAPRESAIKPVSYPAAPVGRPSQTRRHHLTPPPVQRGGANAPERV